MFLMAIRSGLFGSVAFVAVVSSVAFVTKVHPFRFCYIFNRCYNGTIKYLTLLEQRSMVPQGLYECGTIIGSGAVWYHE
jgi:hypothetical protein